MTLSRDDVITLFREWDCSIRKCPDEGKFIKRMAWGFELFCEKHAAEEDATLEVMA